MEVRVEVQSRDPTTMEFSPLVIATFTMVAMFDGKVSLHVLTFGDNITLSYHLTRFNSAGCSQSIDPSDGM